MKKLALGACFYKRPQIERITLWYYDWLRKEYNLNLELIAACSTDEDALAASEAGWVTVMTENRPLGRKHNEMTYAAKDLDIDAFVLIGSDDLLSPQVVQHYYKQPALLFGWTDLWIVNTADGQTRYWSTPQVLGVGRMLHRQVMERVHWCPWVPAAEKGLDAAMLSHVGMVHSYNYSNPPQWARAASDDIGGAIVDFKTDTNIWGFETFDKRAPKAELDTILARFPDEVVDRLTAAFPRLR